jgi:hypothetical protein
MLIVYFIALLMHNVMHNAGIMLMEELRRKATSSQGMSGLLNEPETREEFFCNMAVGTVIDAGNRLKARLQADLYVRIYTSDD